MPSVVRYHTISSRTYSQSHKLSFWLIVDTGSPSSRRCSCEPDCTFDSDTIVSCFLCFLRVIHQGMMNKSRIMIDKRRGESVWRKAFICISTRGDVKRKLPYLCVNSSKQGITRSTEFTIVNVLLPVVLSLKVSQYRNALPVKTQMTEYCHVFHRFFKPFEAFISKTSGSQLYPATQFP